MAAYNMVTTPLRAMSKYIKKADMVILCVSSGYEKSEYCVTEASMAMEYKKKRLVLIMEENYDPKKNEVLHPIVALPLRIKCGNDKQLEDSLEMIFKGIEAGLDQWFDVFTCPFLHLTLRPVLETLKLKQKRINAEESGIA